MIGRPVGVVVAVASLLAAGSAAPGSGKSLRGGTYRVAWTSWDGRLGFSHGLDPTAETGPGSKGILLNLLLRTLVGYRHVAGAAGQELVPDLALRVPVPTNGGRTYTFTLKRGVRFSPPVNRPIVSRDVRYAIERLARPPNGSAWAPVFRDVRGFAAYRSGRARSISGISTPDGRTIAFTLTRPVGDFLHRLALPAAAPLPREMGRCFEGRPAAYGPNLVSSGPYMIEGSGTAPSGPCAAIRPLPGSTAGHLTLVRNPRYDPVTDATRRASPDRFVFVADRVGVQGSRAAAAVRRLGGGELDDAFLPEFWPILLRKYAARAGRAGRLRINPAGVTVWNALNLTQPPFDDVHVRRAFAWIVDRAALREAYGGPRAGRIAHHVVPDLLLGGELESYAPFGTPGDHGDLVRARAEMRRSRYPTRNGVCVAKACRGVRIGSSGPYAPSQRVLPIVKANARRIGISFVNRLRRPDRPSSNNPVVVNVEWLKAWVDPSTFFDLPFSGRSIQASDNLNYSLLGLTRAQAARLGVRGSVERVPGIDREILRCEALAGASRRGCYAALDRKLTAELVPAVPFLWRNAVTILGSQVARWEFDQSTGTTAFARVAVRS